MINRERAGGTWATTAEGFDFDASLGLWVLGCGPGAYAFDFNGVPASSSSLRANLKAVILLAVKTGRTSLAHKDLYAIRAMLQRIAAGEPSATLEAIDLGHVSAFVASLPLNIGNIASGLVCAMRRWADSGAGGLADDLLDALPDMEVASQAPGQAVRACSPTKGAFTEQERDDLHASLDEAYGAGTVCLGDYCMALLTIVLAIRPYQTACLKAGDLKDRGDEGGTSPVLMVPRAKQGTLAREEFTPRALVPALAGVLALQREHAHGWALPRRIVPETAPMFPMRVRRGCPPLPRLPGMAGHMAAVAVSGRLIRLFRRLDVLPQGGERGHFTPLRLRRTAASILASQEWSIEEIAGLLDQDSIGSAIVYIQPSAGLADRIDRALEGRFADIASGFRPRVGSSGRQP